MFKVFSWAGWLALALCGAGIGGAIAFGMTGDEPASYLLTFVAICGATFAAVDECNVRERRARDRRK